MLRSPRNAGIGGDTAAGGLKRLDRDVFAHAATVLIVAFGTNDIGWGVYADEGHKQAYLDAVYFKQGDLPAELAKLAVASDEQLEANQRAVAQPRPYRFVIEPAMPDKKQKK